MTIDDWSIFDDIIYERPLIVIWFAFDTALITFLFIFVSLQPRRLSYSRHAIKDEDTQTTNNYKVHVQVRRMMSENKNLRKRNRAVQPTTGNSSRNDAHEVCIVFT